METYLIFDYDGTLHDTLQIYEPALQQTYDWLVKGGYAAPRKLERTEISGWIGYNSRQMWNLFMPELPESLKVQASRNVGRIMLERIGFGQARLYDGAQGTLRILRSRGYHLIFLSNCKEAYMQAHQQQFHLKDYFTDFYCCESYGFLPKTEIFLEIAKKHVGNYVVIGDRYSDLEVGLVYDFPTVGCSYGYGNAEELKSANILVHHVNEIVNAVAKCEE